MTSEPLYLEYSRQFKWRAWPQAFRLLPQLYNHTVLDLGCGVGDISAELSKRGARVIGVDANPDLVACARSRRISQADFVLSDLRSLPDLGAQVDGIWCSFAAAYFPALAEILVLWRRSLKPGGWIALTEVDDLFAHEPLSPKARDAFARYMNAALRAEAYDFRMGRRLRDQLTSAGFDVSVSTTLPDAELCFAGPAPPDVLEAWRRRLDRLHRLRALCGPDFDAVASDFLAALSHPDHISVSSVHFSLARLNASDAG